MHATLDRLEIFPAKSLPHGIEQEALVFDRDGMFGDREFVIVEAEPHTNIRYEKGNIAEPGHFLSQREDPVLTQLMLIPMEDGSVRLRSRDDNDAGVNFERITDASSENRTRAQVWNWVGEGIDQGDEAAGWLSSHIGRAVRLLGVDGSRPRYVEDNTALGRVGFADGFPLLVTSQASIDEINRRLVEKGKDIDASDRFRANIILGGLEEPFQEDFIERMYVVANGVEMIIERAKPCSRCPIPNTDQVTGERSAATSLLSVMKDRNGYFTQPQYVKPKPKTFFGQNSIIRMPVGMASEQTLTVPVGTVVELEMSEQTNWQRLQSV